MNFQGHEVYKINRNWIFDLTTYTCYKVKLKNDTVSNCDKAFRLVVCKDKETNKYKKIEYIKYIESIPVRVIRKAKEIVRKYLEEALICE